MRLASGRLFRSDNGNCFDLNQKLFPKESGHLHGGAGRRAVGVDELIAHFPHR